MLMNRVIIALPETIIIGSTRHFYLKNGQRTMAVKSYWNRRRYINDGTAFRLSEFDVCQVFFATVAIICLIAGGC